MRLTEEELHFVWDFAAEKSGVAINPKLLTSMVEEIRVSRTTMVDLLNLIRDNLDPDNLLCNAIEDVIGERE